MNGLERLTTRHCKIDRCDKPHDSHGLCSSHAKRLARHGDPLGGTTGRGAAKEFMNDVVLNFEGSECLPWPFGNNGKGYGVFHVTRKAIGAHVYACTIAHGKKPTSAHEVAHSCGKGHMLCCNPKHLRWATRKQNHADKEKHGTNGLGVKNSHAKLTDASVLKIRKLKGCLPQHKIAAKFNVSQMTISLIHRGIRWAHV